MSREETPNRREIEDTTAARLAEIVAGAERAARQVIDEAEAEARERLSGAEEEAERIVAERLAALAELAAEVDARADSLKQGAESLQRALDDVRADFGASEVLDGTRFPHERKAPPPRRGPLPSLTVVGRAPAEPEQPVMREARAAEGAEVGADFAESGARSSRDGEATPAGARGGDAAPAGARLLATQMAVSGASRSEIEARLRNGFAIEDATSILDAILGPES